MLVNVPTAGRDEFRKYPKKLTSPNLLHGSCLWQSSYTRPAAPAGWCLYLGAAEKLSEVAKQDATVYHDFWGFDSGTMGEVGVG